MLARNIRKKNTPKTLQKQRGHKVTPHITGRTSFFMSQKIMRLEKSFLSCNFVGFPQTIAGRMIPF